MDGQALETKNEIKTNTSNNDLFIMFNLRGKTYEH